MHDREFRKLWLGETVSLFGSQVTLLALPLTAILVLNASPFQMGVLGAVEFFPFLALTLLAGAWIDRVRRRGVLVMANAARALLIGSVPVAAALGWLSYAYLLVVALAMGCFTVVFEVAFLAYTPSLVGRDRLTGANARLYGSIAAAEVGGPGLAGALVATVGAPFALVADALSYLVSVASLGAIRRAEPALAVPARRDLRAEIVEGVRSVFGNPLLRAFALEAATFNLFFNAMNATFLLFLTRELGLEPGAVGAVFALGATGSLAGSAIAGRIADRLGLGTTILAAVVLACSVYLVIPFVGGPPLVAAIVIAAVLAIAGAFVAITVIHVITIRQAVTPDRLLARMNASYRTLGYGVIPVGALLGGAIGEAFGLRTALLVGAIGAAAAPIWIVVSPVHRLRRLEDLARADELEPHPDALAVPGQKAA
jgi:MFS family permease